MHITKQRKPEEISMNGTFETNESMRLQVEIKVAFSHKIKV
jgi:hypothetical protein